MDRRAFLSGLFGVAGVAALGGLTMRAAHAAPIARALDPDIKPDAVTAGQTPDGTEVDKAQYYGRQHIRRRRAPRRRRSRVVCRTVRRRGRRVRVCNRVYW